MAIILEMMRAEVKYVCGKQQRVQNDRSERESEREPNEKDESRMTDKMSN